MTLFIGFPVKTRKLLFILPGLDIFYVSKLLVKKILITVFSPKTNNFHSLQKKGFDV